MRIFKDIATLLRSNDCVILPDFGAFILKSKSAYIKKNEFFPPSKYVTFNSMLKDNDGLLAKYLCKERKVSYKKSLNMISDEVSSINEKLSKNLIIDTECIGIFELKDRETLIFNPDLSINFDTSFFGLKPFIREPLILNTSKEKDNLTQNNSNYLLRYAAIFITAIGLSYFGYFNYSNYINTEKLKNIAIAQDKILENIQTATFNLGELPPIDINVSAPLVNNFRYYSVIAGSFRSKRNAEKQLNNLLRNGYKASYTSINPKGLFRVAYARLNTRKEAAELISKIKDSGQDAWLLIEN
tara:strand:- start:2126 stop:3022 length:897 start_codon:yes stop_codon:yes gene_type:complete